MKKTYTSIILACATLFAVSCNKTLSCADYTPAKPEVEKHFDPKGPVPTAVLNGETFTTDGVKATVSATFSGVTEDMEELSLGVIASTDPTFLTSTFVAADQLADGTFSFELPVSANKKMYFKAVAANNSGSCYSETFEYQIPDVAFHLKAPGTYAAKVVSAAYGDEYTSTITVLFPDETDHTKCVVANLEPYYFGKGNVYPNFNWCAAVADGDKGTITIKIGTSMHLGSFLCVGLNAKAYADATATTDVVFTLTESGNLYRERAFGPYGSDGFDDVYEGDVTYIRK